MTTDPITVYRDTPVQEVAQLMVENGISGLPVLDRDGTLVGVVTEEDLIVRHANLHLPTYILIFAVRGEHQFEEEMRRTLATHAGEVMSEHLYTITADADVADAATLMMDKHTSPIPVMEGTRLVGVISRTDIVRLVVNKDTAAEEASAT